MERKTTKDEKRFNNLLKLMMIYKKEINRCETAKIYIAGCIMIGAALEASLLSMVEIYPQQVKSALKKLAIKKKIKEKYSNRYKWGLNTLLLIGFELGWLPYNETRIPNEGELGDWLVNYLKELRNFVHPGKWIKEYTTISLKKSHFNNANDLFKAAISHLQTKVGANLQKWWKRKRATFKRRISENI